MSSARGFLLQPVYRLREGRPVVQLFGKLESGAPFQIEDDRFRPYFFAPAEAAALLRGQSGVEVRESPHVDLAGRPVVEIEVGAPGEVPPLRERLRQQGFAPLEADLRFAYRYLIDHGVRTELSIEGEATAPKNAIAPDLACFANPSLSAAELAPELRTLSIDIETTPDASLCFAVALVGCGVQEVHLVADRPVAGAIVHADERALLEAVEARFAALDPDVILGWNVVDFDLRVLVRRAQAQGWTLQLGRVRGETWFRQDPGFTRQSRAEIPGRVVLDGIPLVRDALRLEDYRLETVGQHVLGRGKRIDQSAPNKAHEILRMWKQDPEALVAYNLEDAVLVPEILEKEGLLELTIERSRLSGMPLDRVGASVASFDLLYLPELRKRGVVAPSVESERENVIVQGGALLEPQPGLYANVAVFDFKSLYPSLIRTFRLDPLAHARAGEDAVVAPNGARFSRSGEAILPEVIERFAARREAAKKRGAHHADQALKIMMNALFGVLGTPACRFFDPEIANAITGFGQQMLGWTREAFEAEGRAVLYGDTDSVFVQLASGGEAGHQEAAALRGRVESGIAARVREAHGVVPRLTLELEHVFDRLFLPRVRSRRAGSKKRYAGTIAGELRIVGLESVRRDWPRVAKRLQIGMLERLFRDDPVLPFVKDVLDRVLTGELDRELVYVKRIRKGALDQYKATHAPHVVAARKANQKGGVIRYVMTSSGAEPVEPGEPLPPAIDRRHYLEHVLRPIADAILVELGQDTDDALGAPKQLDLL